MEEADESETSVSITWHAVFGEVREYVVLYKPANIKPDVWSVVSTKFPNVSLENLHDSHQYTMQVLVYTVNGEVYASNTFNFKTGKGIWRDLMSLFQLISHSDWLLKLGISCTIHWSAKHNGRARE